MITCDICGGTISSSAFLTHIASGDRTYDTCPTCDSNIQEKIQESLKTQQEIQAKVIEEIVASAKK